MFEISFVLRCVFLNLLLLAIHVCPDYFLYLFLYYDPVVEAGFFHI